MQDYCAIYFHTYFLIIDSKKIRRDRNFVRNVLAYTFQSRSTISPIHLDYRDDQTQIFAHTKWRVTTLSEPVNQYVAPVTSSSGMAKDVSRELIDVCLELNII